MGEGRERIPRKTLKFFGEARCAVPCLWCCRTLARLPCLFPSDKGFDMAPCTIDIHIDAGIYDSVIRATLLRYTLKSLPVNVLVCGKQGKEVEDLGASCRLNSIPDKGFSYVWRSFSRFRTQTFHNHPLHSIGVMVPDFPDEIPHQGQIHHKYSGLTCTRAAHDFINFQRQE
jgi:hypothetical protein